MRITLFLLAIAFGAAQAQIRNYKLGEIASPSMEGASVAVNPRNTKNIVAYAMGKVVVTSDAGATWKPTEVTISPGIKGTPKLRADSKGNFVLLYSTLTQIVAQYSTDDGKTWSEPVMVSLPAGSQYNPNIAINPKKESYMVTWTQSGALGTESDTCKSNIMLSTSGNGRKWSKPVKVNQNPGNCIDEDFTLRGSTPLMGVDGKEFIVWAGLGAMYYDRSYDGTRWINTDLAITEQEGGWTLQIPGFGSLANTPVVAIDNSASRMHGTIFLAYSDLTSGENDTDIWLARSVNRGDNWTSAARINQDKPGKDQFLPRISVDPSNGYVYLVYYDRRDCNDLETNVYLAWSTDGGNQFKEKKITEKPFVADIHSLAYMADLIDLSVQKGTIAVAWTGSEEGMKQVYTGVIRHEDLAK